MNNEAFQKPVLIKISDPWDLGEALGWQPLTARIIKSSGTAVLIKLEVPFAYKGLECEYFVASARHVGDDASKLFEGAAVFCAMTQISEESAQSQDPFDLSAWRGGVGIIAAVEPA